MQPIRSLTSRLRTITLWDIAAHLFVFATYFLASKLGLYIFFDLHSSPALILPSIGFGLAAVFIGGNQMLLPIALAQFLSQLGNPTPLVVICVATVSYTLQAYVGAAILRHFRFNSQFEKARDVIWFILLAFIVPVIGPLINTIAFAALHSLPLTALLTFTRAWAGGISSVLIVSPFAFAVSGWKHIDTPRRKKIEIALAFATIIAIDILLFWTPYPQNLGISVIFLMPAIFVWFVLRIHPRWLTVAVFGSTVIGITGSIIAHASAVALNSQLLSDELYIAFMAAMFLVFSVVAEDRRVTYRAVEQNNRELTAALSRLSEEDRAKTEFIAILAHELRNPLAPIVSAHEWLLLQEQTPESKTALISAQKHSTMIRHLLDDLLDSVRVSQHTFSLKKEAVSLHDMLDQSVQSTADFLQSRRHTLRVTRPEQDVVLFADPIRLKQILINLLNNAGKYTEPGGVIQLSAVVEEPYVVLQVTDNGIGIDSEAQLRIFNPFHREGPATHLGTGLGIGLSLTKRLVDMHDGTIEVNSEGVGYGSTFIVRLPLPTLPLTLDSTVSETKSSMTPAKIVIVDDNIDAVEGLKKLLEYNNHAVEVAYTGEEALSVVRRVQPELLLLDIGLPDVSGYEVARRLREAGYKHTIVALTGYGQKSDKDQSTQAGFNYHLVKPVSVSDIFELLSNIQNPKK